MDREAFLTVANEQLENLTSTHSAVTRENSESENGMLTFEKGVKGALKSYVKDAAEGDVLLLIDDTVMGSGKKGVVMTTDGIYFSASFSKPFHIRYSDIGRADLGDDGYFDKEKITEDYDKMQLHVYDKSGNEVYVYDTTAVHKRPLKLLVDAALEYLV